MILPTILTILVVFALFAVLVVYLVRIIGTLEEIGEALEAGAGIVGNTAHVQALDRIIALAGPIGEKAGGAVEATEAIERILTTRAG